jgi:DNA-directed RNA polymerase
MGNDLNRGMLEFSEPKPLGEMGLWWLKIHCANKIGKDKLPLKDRALYTESIMDNIHKCAEDPKANTWWLDTENPW